MDCVAHAINYAVGYPCFTCREQIVSVTTSKMKKSKVKAV